MDRSNSIREAHQDNNLSFCSRTLKAATAWRPPLAHFDDEQAYRELEPVVPDAVARMRNARFSTKSLIDEARSTPAGEEAYQRALAMIVDDGATEHMARMIVHGQVVPGLLRRCGLVRFAGFIHGDPNQEDGFSVPSWWERR